MDKKNGEIFAILFQGPGHTLCCKIICNTFKIQSPGKRAHDEKQCEERETFCSGY